MRIGYVHSRAFPAVDANVVQVVQMCRAFATLGHQVTLFIPRREEYDDDSTAMSAARELFGDRLGFEVVFVPRKKYFGRFEVLGSVRGTLQALKRRPQDLIYSRNPWSVAFLSSLRTPFIWEAHEEQVHMRSRILGALLRQTIVRASKKPQLVKLVTISEALAQVWGGFGVPESKLVSAHDAVDLEMFGAPQSRDAARSKLGISSTRRVIVYTGALKSDRGIEMILESARRISEAEFYVVGGSDEELAYWRSQTELHGLRNVHFPGKVAHCDIPIWLSAADVLLMMWTWRVATIRVCSPMKLFEYMAAGRVIVGPAFPTVLEVLEANHDAILFEPDNLDKMEQALRDGLRVCDDPSMPKRAFEKVSRDYTWEARCRKILDSIDL